MGGGTVLDLGVYTIQVCQWAFQSEPISIEATGILNKDGVDSEMTAELKYGDNKVGKIKTSGLKTQENRAIIVGSKGKMTVNEALYFSLLQRVPLYLYCFFSHIDTDILVSNICY